MIRVFLVALLVILGAGLADGAELTGRVVRVTDGDTLTLLTPQRRQLTIRLTEIDAPEGGQPWGARSKQALSQLVFRRDVRIMESGKDQYGRTLGRIYVGATDVSAEMVRTGSAWAYRQYLTDPSLLTLEQEARNAKRGLWSLPANQIVAPWEWRNGTPAPVASFPRPAPQASGQACGDKRYCSEMSSCAEARHYLNVCGVPSLDGDRDGVPCENICRRPGQR
jgi:endonuclease YncB( thermonuclease family)